MAGLLRERAAPSVAGDAPIDKARIVGEAGVGAEPEPLHHAGAIAFDKDVGGPDQLARMPEARRVLEVERDGEPAAQEEIVLARVERVRLAAGARDAHHRRAVVGEHHPAEGRRADRIELDDADTGENPACHGAAFPTEPVRQDSAKARRVDMTRSGLEGFGRTLTKEDEVVIEATGNAIAV